MKHLVTYSILVFALILISSSDLAAKDDFPVLKGPYLGQKPPGLRPEIFAHGIVSTEHKEHSTLAFSSDGKEVYWSIWPKSHSPKIPQVIKFMKIENGKWSKPQVAPFSGKYMDGGPCFFPDGKKLFFYSNRSLKKNGKPKEDTDFWYVKKTKNGWSDPEHAGFIINSKNFEQGLSFSADGKMYFSVGYKVNGKWESDLFLSTLKNGVYSKPVNISLLINTTQCKKGYIPYISPDESFIIFSTDCRRFSPKGKYLGGKRQLVITFRKDDNTWFETTEMGPAINISYEGARFPGISPDGNYLFFTRYDENWNEDLYWVDAKIIEELRPDELKKSRDDGLQKYLRLSVKAYQSKDYSEYHRLMSKIVELEPQNYRHSYNLACACALNGNVQNTVKILQFLLNEDYNLAILAETDSDFDPIRNTAPFQEIIKCIKEKTRPLNNSHIAFSIPEKDLIPEGIAYDPVDEAFYLGSVQKCKIIRIDKHGKIYNFTESRQDGLVPVLGMRIDAKRRFLWAVTSYGFYKANIPRGLLGTTGVFKYDLQTKKLLKKYMLPQEENHMLNDLTIGSNGEVYATDWRISAIYLISSDKDTIEKFYDLPRRPNGIDFSGDGTKLFIAGAGIGVLDILTKTFKELKHPVNMYLSGDGLYYYQNSLIAVQNGGLRKITRFYLNDAQDEIVHSQALEAYHSLFNLPTTGVITGKHFYYIANSQLRAYDNDGKLFPLNKLEVTKILKIELHKTDIEETAYEM